MSRKRTDWAKKRMEETEEITRVLGDEKADSLMISVDEAQSCLDSAIEQIFRNRFTVAWDKLKEAEKSLLKAILLHNEFLVRKENERRKTDDFIDFLRGKDIEENRDFISFLRGEEPEEAQK